MDKLSICFISNAYYPMQGAISLYNYSRELAAMGHNVYVISSMRENEKISEIVDGFIVERIPMKAPLGIDIIGKSKFCYYLIKKLINLINIEKINIVHIYGFYGSFPIMLVKAIKPLAKTKWFYDIRSCSVMRNKVLRYLFNTLIKLETKLYDGILIIDDMLSYLVKNDNVFLEPLGVDLELFKNRRDRSKLSKYGIKNDDLVIVYLGSLSPSRRIEKLLKAFYLAAQKVDNLWLMILGTGSALDFLKSLTVKFGISDRVLFLGYIEYRKVPYFLSNSDIGISYIPMVHYYDIQPPQKIIEYLACSLPVIATNTRGNKRYLINEINGLLTQDDPISLSEAIIRLSLDSNLRNYLSRNARSSVKDYDSIKITRKFLLPAYKSILNNNNNV